MDIAAAAGQTTSLEGYRMSIEEKYNLELRPLDLEADDSLITPERWMGEVRRVLQRVEGTKVGPILLNAIRSSGRWVRIQPFWRSSIKNSITNMLLAGLPVAIQTRYADFLSRASSG